MRTTVTLDEDVAAAVDQLRQEARLGLSEAVNHLVRRGLVHSTARTPFRQESSKMASLIDVSNIGEVLELLEGPTHR